MWDTVPQALPQDQRGERQETALRILSKIEVLIVVCLHLHRNDLGNSDVSVFEPAIPSQSALWMLVRPESHLHGVDFGNRANGSSYLPFQNVAKASGTFFLWDVSELFLCLAGSLWHFKQIWSWSHQRGVWGRWYLEILIQQTAKQSCKHTLNSVFLLSRGFQENTFWTFKNYHS